jgi:hypothetical protein
MNPIPTTPIFMPSILARSGCQVFGIQILERLGYRADIAENGTEVFTALQTRDYDVILINLEMPQMNGLKVAREIRQISAERWIRIIGMTAPELLLAISRDRMIRNHPKMTSRVAVAPPSRSAR